MLTGLNLVVVYVFDTPLKMNQTDDKSVKTRAEEPAARYTIGLQCGKQS